MPKLQKQDVLAVAREEGVTEIRLQFTDILGVIKNVAIPVDQLPKALDGQLLFDGSSIEGFVRIEESDMLLVPDPGTFVLLPWSEDGSRIARLMCDVYNPDGTPFAGCPRLALKKVAAEAEAMGYVMNAGVEAEFFLFQRDPDGRGTTRTHDQASYFDLAPMDRGEDARHDMVLALEKMGFEVEASHHEVAPAQHEIDFKYADALTTADNLVTFRWVVRRIALKHGLHATFMPKPIFGINGSGMHTHQSLFRGNENAFFDPSTPNQLSTVCMHYIGGLMTHAKAITAVCNPLVNSYKRLVPGYEAPVYIAWADRNRSPLIRVPARRGLSTRIEFRSPDPSCNPYLALAVMLKAGLDGIRKRIQPPPPQNRNLYRMTPDEREMLGVDTLPGTLWEALQELDRDPVVQEALGEHIYHRFREAKIIEWNAYRTQVHPWELEQYLQVF
ncbi:MAG: type I glutamate--ammonia ligase [Bacillota bacterium]|nr:type I glutamate--ammonia ligase [Bacillota bacterium]MDI7249947.1 type I glutamate--ammonia ligase [Bacillota bacterium]